MKEKNNNIGNSILVPIASIHVSIISIIVVVLITLYFYAENKIDIIKERLNDNRYQVEKVMASSFSTKMSILDKEDYFNDGIIDINKINAEIYNLCSRRYQEKDGEQEASDGERLHDLIVLLSANFPYSNRTEKTGITSSIPKRTIYDRNWRDAFDKISRNVIINKDTILKKVAQYEQVDRQRNPSEYEGKFEAALNEKGAFVIREPIKMVSEFYNRINYVYSNIAPSIENSEFNLKYYQNKFKLKNRLLIALITIIALIIFGVLIPLIMHLFMKPPIQKKIELRLLILTFLPYIVYLFYFLTKVLGSTA